MDAQAKSRDTRIQQASIEGEQTVAPLPAKQNELDSQHESVDISLVDESQDLDDSLYFEEVTEEAEMLTTENLYEQRNGYQNGEYGGLLKRLVTRARLDSVLEDSSF